MYYARMLPIGDDVLVNCATVGLIREAWTWDTFGHQKGFDPVLVERADTTSVHAHTDRPIPVHIAHDDTSLPIGVVVWLGVTDEDTRKGRERWWSCAFRLHSGLLAADAKDLIRVGTPVSAGFSPVLTTHARGIGAHVHTRQRADLLEVSLAQRGAYDGARVTRMLPYSETARSTPNGRTALR